MVVGCEQINKVLINRRNRVKILTKGCLYVRLFFNRVALQSLNFMATFGPYRKNVFNIVINRFFCLSFNSVATKKTNVKPTPNVGFCVTINP